MTEPPRRRAARSLLRAARLLVLAAVTWHLAAPPFFTYPEPRPFHGARWYNPYAGDLGAGWRAGTHAHGETWWGLAAEHATNADIARAYQALDYDLIGLSNYQRLTPDLPVGRAGVDFPMYEHGFGPWQHHQTVIGADAVTWWDYPLWQTLRQEQDVIRRLARDDAFVVLNHPVKRGAYDPEELRRLSGYHALELATSLRDTVYGREYWDAALSAGHPVWGVCSDDYHGAPEDRLGIGGLDVFPRTRDAAGVQAALFAGRFTARWDPERTNTNRLLECRVEGDELCVRVAEPVDRIHFIGQDGKWRAGRRGVTEARYRFAPEDTYLRVEFHNGESTVFLNPVFRHEDPPLADARYAIAAWSGWARAGILLAALGLALRWTRRRPTPPVSTSC